MVVWLASWHRLEESVSVVLSFLDRFEAATLRTKYAILPHLTIPFVRTVLTVCLTVTQPR